MSIFNRESLFSLEKFLVCKSYSRFLDGVGVAVLDFRDALAVALDGVEEALNVGVDVDHLISEQGYYPAVLQSTQPKLVRLLLL